MVTKRIFILDGHPAPTSLSRSLTLAYAKSAEKAGHDVRIAHLNDLAFDPDWGQGGFEAPKPLEPDLETFLQNLEWCDHMVLATPMWWGGLPAKLKGLIDRSFLPGRTFDTRNKTKIGMPSPMLTGRTAHLILTSDTPNWFFRFVYGYGLVRLMKRQVFGFVGIKPVHVTHFSGASEPAPEQVRKWLMQAEAMGAAAT